MMQPKDLLVHLEKGDRTMEFLKKESGEINRSTFSGWTNPNERAVSGQKKQIAAYPGDIFYVNNIGGLSNVTSTQLSSALGIQQQQQSGLIQGL